MEYSGEQVLHLLANHLLMLVSVSKDNVLSFP